MEDFGTEVFNSNNELADYCEDATLLVSPPCEKDGKVYAFVSVEWEGKTAEFKIPEVSLVSNSGFSEEQINTLCEYIRDNVPMLKQEAAGINIFDNLYGKNQMT